METVVAVLVWPVEKWGKAMDSFDHWIWFIPPISVLPFLFAIVTIIPVFSLGVLAILLDQYRRNREEL